MLSCKSTTVGYAVSSMISPNVPNTLGIRDTTTKFVVPGSIPGWDSYFHERYECLFLTIGLLCT